MPPSTIHRFILLPVLIVFLNAALAQKNYKRINLKTDSLVRAKMKQYSIPGLSILVLKDRKPVHQKAYGFANLKWKQPATVGTNYLIGSITKTFTAAAVLLLWEQGLLQLDDSIGRYLDYLPSQWKPVTIRQLLHHTAGIPSNLDEPQSMCKFQVQGDSYTRQDVIAETACLPLEFRPGTKFRYSGRGYYLLGLLVEKLSGKEFGSFLKEKFFLPLGMKETSMIDYKHILPFRAQGYVMEKDSLLNSPQMDPVVELSDGGLMSSISDLAKWHNGLLSGSLLKPSTIAMMHINGKLEQNNAPVPYGMGFGLSPFLGKKRFGHTGGIPGFSSCYTHFPENGITVILLTNISHEDFQPGLMGNEISALYF